MQNFVKDFMKHITSYLFNKHMIVSLDLQLTLANNTVYFGAIKIVW